MSVDLLLEKLARIPQFYSVRLNHSKDKIAFYWDKTGRNELYTMDLETKEFIQHSHGEIPRTIRSGFVWTRDDEGIIFAKDKDGNEQHDLYHFNLENGEIKQLTNTPSFQEHATDTSPDGKYLLFRSTRNGQMNLFRYNFENEEIEELTNFSKPVMGGAKWSPTGDYIVFSYNDTQNFQNLDVWMMNPDGSNLRKIISMREGSRDGVADISKDGKLLVISSDFEGNSRVGIYSLETEELKWFGNGASEEYGVAITSDNKYVIGSRNHKATVSPIMYNIETGEEIPLKFPPGIVSGAMLSKDDQYLIVRLNSSTSPSSLIKYNFKTSEIDVLIPVQL
ncbi:MAG: TolB family protein, partial [Candidatus Heimdallarchaeaceae archaeon]